MVKVLGDFLSDIIQFSVQVSQPDQVTVAHVVWIAVVVYVACAKVVYNLRIHQMSCCKTVKYHRQRGISHAG